MLVTGYIPLHRASRPHDEYLRRGNILIGMGNPTTAFLELPAGSTVTVGPNVAVRPTVLAECWMLPAARRFSLPPTDNPEKDTAEFLAVQAQKSEWLAQAAFGQGAGAILGWVDFGILHIPSIDPYSISQWARRLPRANPNRITVPSIWGPPPAPPDPTKVSWHFAGGALIVPAHLAMWFHEAVESEASRLIEERGMVTWEVNLWAAVAHRYPDRFSWYRCDHNNTMFTEGPHA